MLLLYSWHHCSHFPKWKRLWGTCFINPAFFFWPYDWDCEHCWENIWKELVLAVVLGGGILPMKILTSLHEFIFAKQHHANQIRERQFWAQILCTVIKGETINVMMDAQRQFNVALEKIEAITTGRAPVMTEKINGAVTRDVLTTTYLVAGEEKSRAQYRYLQAITHYLK